MQGGLWETLFVRRERAAHFAGGVSFEYRGAQVVAIRNETEETLQGAFVMDAGGNVYPVGDVAPGARGTVAATPTLAMGASNPQAYAAEDATMIGLTRTLGLEAEESDVVYGLMMVAGGSLQAHVPSLYARLGAPTEEIAGRFEMEDAIRLLRVVARPTPYTLAPSNEMPLPEAMEERVEELVEGEAVIEPEPDPQPELEAQEASPEEAPAEEVTP